MTQVTETEAAVDRMERRMADRRAWSGEWPTSARAQEVWVVVEFTDGILRGLPRVATTVFAAEADARELFDASTYGKFLKKETVR